MKRVNNKKNLYKSIILLVIVVIGIGYAYLTSNLSITGSTEVVANTWDIHFENLNVTNGSVTATTPAEIDSNETNIEYAIALSRPKEYYEFTVDVVNEGTLPGKVSISELSGLDTTSSKVIDYSIKYTNGNPVNVGDILNGGATKTIKVRVYYKDDITASDFPSSNLNLNLTYTLQYIQSEKDEFDTNALIEQLEYDYYTCFNWYGENVTDQVGVTKIGDIYYNACADKRNIIFNNMCWQMIRTTQTGGIKMIYNGEPDGSGQCGSSREDHKGIVQSNYNNQTLSSNYLYGSSFTYDTSTSNFTLTDTETATWSDSTYENLIGKFTCKSSSDTCTTIYKIDYYVSNTSAQLSSYKIGDINYGGIAVSNYNAYENSPAMVGYMFNKVYKYKSGVPTSGSLTGNDVSYSNGIYTLLPVDGETELGTTLDNTHHYTCNSASSTCSQVRYYYYYYNYNGNYSSSYIVLDGAENIQAAINEMLYNDDVNKYNSSIKGIIDSWYAQNLSSKTNMLEDTVFCNERNTTSIGGWDKDGRITDYSIDFKGIGYSNDISCSNITDQFAVSNNKAKLTYPVALATFAELYTLTNNNSYSYHNLTEIGVYWWGLSPNALGDSESALVNVVDSGGSVIDADYVSLRYAVRPVVSLKSGTVISGGSGSTTDPYVISE